jgi:hypothetical protein
MDIKTYQRFGLRCAGFVAALILSGPAFSDQVDLVCLASNPFNAGQSFQIHFDEQAQLVTLDQERPRKATISNSAITWIATNGLVWTVDRLLGTFFSHEQGQDLNPPMGGYARGTCQKPPPRKF